AFFGHTGRPPMEKQVRKIVWVRRSGVYRSGLEPPSQALEEVGRPMSRGSRTRDAFTRERQGRTAEQPQRRERAVAGCGPGIQQNADAQPKPPLLLRGVEQQDRAPRKRDEEGRQGEAEEGVRRLALAGELEHECGVGLFADGSRDPD